MRGAFWIILCDVFYLFATRATWSTQCHFLTRFLLYDQGSGKWWFWYCLMRSPFTSFLPLLLLSQIQSLCKRCWMQLRLAERSMTRWLISSSLLEGPFRRPCRFSFNEKVCKNGPLKAAQTSCCPAQDWMYVDAWTDKRVNTSCYLRVVISYWTKLHLSNFSGAETPVTVTPRCRLLYSFCASVGYEDRQSSLSRPATV